MEDEYKQVDATLSIEVHCHCPYCGSFEDVFEEVRELLDPTTLSAENCDKEIKCSECGRIFVIDNVNY